MNYLSVCAGIEAATVAWHPLGWKPVLYSEIEKFPRKVLRHHYPTVPLWGDFTAIRPRFLRRLGVALPDILVGGTPCQAFSLAGARLSLADARGNLTLSFVRLAHALANTGRLRNAVWENVPGVLSTSDNAFGCFLGALVGADDAIQPPAGGPWPSVGMVSGPRARLAWRVFDAQFFGLAQRRRRVFVVVDFGNGADPASVLFERLGLQGNSAPRREATEGVAAAVTASVGGVSGKDAIDGRVIGFDGQNLACSDDVFATLDTGAAHTNRGLHLATFAPEIARCVATREGSSQDFETTTMIAHTLRGEGFDASEDGTGRGTPIVPVAFSSKDFGADATFDLSPTLRASGHSTSHANGESPPAIAFDARQSDVCVYGDRTGPVDTKQPGPAALVDMAVRRLTPRECERLQGFPDDYTLIAANTPDGHRYKALGNSMAVPCMAWIGQRIAENMPAANDNGRTAGRAAA